MAEQEAVGMELQVPEAVGRGVYADVLSSTVGANEVTLDFIFVEPHPTSQEVTQKRGYLVSRVVISKSQLRPVVELLQRQLADLENGESDVPKQ